MSTAPTFQMLGPCVCGCGIVGTKLVAPLKFGAPGHVRGCKCRPHIGKRNQRAGKASERRRHQRLGGVGWTPADELMHSYSINVTTSDKYGAQVNAAFVRFIESEFLRRALLTAVNKIPVGSDALPAVWLEPPRKGSWLLVKVPPRGLR